MVAPVGKLFKKYAEHTARVITVPTQTKPFTLLLEAASGRVFVTITGSGDYTRSVTETDGSVTTGIPAGGVGLSALSATAVPTGSFVFPVIGVTAGGTVNGGAGTPKGTPVYLIAGAGLTLSSAGNTLVARVEEGTIVGTSTPIQIGALA